jgi:hypothetical protein
MYDHILLWVGLGVLTFLCLHVPHVQKLILEVSAWMLRLGMIALLAGGAYLWFRPGEMPAGMSGLLNDFPGFLSLFPERGSPAFALCLACGVVTALVPLLAVLDVSRKLAGRVCQIRTLTATPRTPIGKASRVSPSEEPMPIGVPILRPIERRKAAEAMASAGSHPATPTPLTPVSHILAGGTHAPTP